MICEIKKGSQLTVLHPLSCLGQNLGSHLTLSLLASQNLTAFRHFTANIWSKPPLSLTWIVALDS